MDKLNNKLNDINNKLNDINIKLDDINIKLDDIKGSPPVEKRVTLSTWEQKEQKKSWKCPSFCNII